MSDRSGERRPADAATARAHRRPGRRIDRLSLRLAVGVFLLVVPALVAGFYAISRGHYERAVTNQRRASALQTRVLEAALRHQMIDQDLTLTASILAEIGREPDVRGAMILNHDGEVRVASDSALVGTVMPQESESCMGCHAARPEDRETWIVLHEEKEDVLRSVLPIENRPECYACHAPEQRLNGILILDTSLEELAAELDRDALVLVVGTGLLGLLLLGGMGLLVRRFVLARLARLGGAARSIAAGNLCERVPVEGDDVLSALAVDFNSMAGTVANLVTEVREREAQLLSIMDSIDDGLVVLDASSRVVAANRSFCRRVGLDVEALRGRPCHAEAKGRLPCCNSSRECPAALCMETAEVQRDIYHRPPEDGARQVVEEVYASPVRDADGRVVQVVEIWRDITDRVEEEQRLAEIEHLVSLGTLASGFSHEVNTPLASVLTCAESALDRIARCPDPASPPADLIPALQDLAGITRDQVLRCRRITERFLRFSRGIPPASEPVDLREVVDGVVALVAGTARESRVSIEVRSRDDLPAVRANTEVVQHVVLNLLVNAIQSCEGREGLARPGGHVAVELEQADGTARIRVRDDGCGIPAAGRENLFAPFRSNKPGGTGLGLFLSRSFMRRFGGDLRLVESGVGVGSCFEVSFERLREVAT